MLDYTFQWRVVWKVWPSLAQGALVTIELTILSMLIGIAIAMFLSVFRRSRSRPLYYLATGWVELARNTPALVQVYVAYFGLGAFGLHLSSYTAVLGAIAFNNAGYLTEILRGGLESISPQQRKAAISLGMTQFQAYRYIVFPQVLRIVFRPTMNQVIWAMFGTTLGSFIGLEELFGATLFESGQVFRPFEFYTVAAVAFYVIAKSTTLASRAVSARLFRY